MAKEINLEENNEQFTSKWNNNLLYRDQLEYTGSRIFWGSALVLGMVSIYAALAYVVVQQLKK